MQVYPDGQDKIWGILPDEVLSTMKLSGIKHHKPDEMPSSPSFEITNSDVVARADDTALVQSTVELHYDLASSAVVQQLEFSNVA